MPPNTDSTISLRAAVRLFSASGGGVFQYFGRGKIFGHIENSFR